MERRGFLRATAAAAGAALVTGEVACATGPRLAPSTAVLRTPDDPWPRTESWLEGASIRDLRTWMEIGEASSARITEGYLARIDGIDRSGPALNSVIELNPDALDIAERLDAERAAGRVLGPLHGIPILIKDNIDTGTAC